VIRVNLLPQKRAVRGGAPQASQRWLLIVLGVVVLEIVGLFLFHQTKIEERDTQTAKNQQLTTQIQEKKDKVKDHEEVKKALAVLHAREDAIAKLQLRRSGPTAVLLELAQILTLNRGPTASADWLDQQRKNNPLNVYNPGWDSRRLWLTSYLEDERTVRIEGLARDLADVSELAQRLRLSVYFYDVQILAGKKQTDAKTKLDLVSFALQLKVRY